MSQPWLHIIGIGEDGLDGLNPAARTALDRAEIMIGGNRHLAMIPPDSRPRLPWPSPFSALIPTIADFKPKYVAVLATGDPMWFGVGATLAKHFPLDELSIHPTLSAFNLAAARIGWPLAECETITLHGRPFPQLQSAIQPAARLLILTHDGDTPAKVATTLCQRGYSESRLTVLEHMSGPDEARSDGTAATWGDRKVEPFHTLAVECIADPDATLLPLTPGLPDEAFEHDGQITKREVRAATLAALAPTPGALLWDVGAGSGSIGIEWMRAAPRTRALAIERDQARIKMITANAATLGVPTLQIIAGQAPGILADLPAPDAVFIGGGLTAQIVEPCWNALKLGGRLVANAVTLEGENVLFEAQKALGGFLTRIAVSRAEPVGPFLGWRPLMPVTQWSVRK